MRSAIMADYFLWVAFVATALPYVLWTDLSITMDVFRNTFATIRIASIVHLHV
jgi:hypothetical protein